MKCYVHWLRSQVCQHPSHNKRHQRSQLSLGIQRGCYFASSSGGHNDYATCGGQNFEHFVGWPWSTLLEIFLFAISQVLQTMFGLQEISCSGGSAYLPFCKKVSHSTEKHSSCFSFSLDSFGFLFSSMKEETCGCYIIDYVQVVQ